jgi:hypothetical protein
VEEEIWPLQKVPKLSEQLEMFNNQAARSAQNIIRTRSDSPDPSPASQLRVISPAAHRRQESNRLLQFFGAEPSNSTLLD